MHIPDGFIDGGTSLAAGVLAAGGTAVALKVAGRELDDKRVPLAGVTAAFVFAVQMLNFPVAAGTSGHLLGGALAAVLVGPWVGSLCITVVLAVQALVFADGGLSALGLNVVNMSFVGVFGGWLLYRALRSVLPVVAASGVAAGLSVVLASIGFVVEYAVGGAGGASVGTVAAAMVGVHLLIGIGEGIITALTVSAVLASRPDLVHGAQRPATKVRPRFAVAGLAVAAGLAVFVSPMASSSPDGLEKVAIDEGFIDTATDHALADIPTADYAIRGVEDERVSVGLAGLLGVAVTFAVALGLHAVVRRRTPSPRPA